MTTLIGIHGNAVSFAENPDQLQPINGNNWTNHYGAHFGWGCSYQGAAGASSWFHFAVTSAGQLLSAHEQLDMVEALLDVDVGVFLESIHVWDMASNRLAAIDGLHRSSSTAHFFSPALATDAGIGVSLNISFTRQGTVTFRGVNARFVPGGGIALPPTISSFAGMATLVTDNSNATGPYVTPCTGTFSFNSNGTVLVNSLTISPIATSGPVGTVVVTFAPPGTGTWSSSTRAMGLGPLSLNAAAAGMNGTTSLTLTTGLATGSLPALTGVPLSPAGTSGAVTLVGQSTLSGTIANGTHLGFTLAGTLTPSP